VIQLWPPNHKYEEIDLERVLAGVTSGIRITSITQDEPCNGDCDGDGVGTSVAHIRCERDGSGNGRVYKVNYTALGGSCSGSLTVAVPHDHSGRQPVDDGQRYDSTDGCR